MSVVVSRVSYFVDGIVVIVLDESEASASVEAAFESPVVVLEAGGSWVILSFVEVVL